MIFFLNEPKLEQVVVASKANLSGKKKTCSQVFMLTLYVRYSPTNYLLAVDFKLALLDEKKKF